MCCLFAIVCLGSVLVILVLAYVKGDVPDYLQHRWKFHATFVPYFFSALIAAYAAIVFSFAAACFNPKPSRFLLIVPCVAALIAHGQWERHLRCPQSPAWNCLDPVVLKRVGRIANPSVKRRRETEKDGWGWIARTVLSTHRATNHVSYHHGRIGNPSYEETHATFGCSHQENL
jgi:hypothetical protein